MSIVSFIPKALRKGRPLISLCHTTARLPEGWRASAQAWLDNCDHPENVEHVLVWDAKHGIEAVSSSNVFPNTTRLLNIGRECAVDGWNTSARAARGDFLISLSDDIFPCPHWDTELLKAIPDINGEYVLEVSTGGDPGVLTFSMLTRKYFERLTRCYGYDGGFFYGEYLGMHGDTEFTKLARRDSVVIDARHLVFNHVHPAYNTAPWDETYRHQQRPEAYAHGHAVYERRLRELNFPPESVEARQVAKKKVALCMPGEGFSSSWVANMMCVFAELTARYDVAPVFCESSNVYVTRMAIAESIVKSGTIPDYVIWIDDDNIVTARDILMLIEDLDASEEIACVAGFCWCLANNYGVPPKLSVGTFRADGLLESMTYEELMAGDEHVKPIGWTGFPAVAMKGDVLVKVGVQSFAPILSDATPWGFWGEDIAFCIRARDAGLKFFVDRRVKVPHLKFRDANPTNLEVSQSAPDTGSERKTA